MARSRFLGAVLCLLAGAAQAGPHHFANADDQALVARGTRVYAEACSACHGHRLQGQPLWQLMDRFAGRRAPAHDATGHTWQHSDEDLFHITAYGRFAGTPRRRVSYMPAFQGALSAHDILAVLAFIKSRWPTGLRISQAMLNPGMAGIPADADRTDWTFPPNCSATVR
jgi:mono/diheme cytochrome c family protein